MFSDMCEVAAGAAAPKFLDTERLIASIRRADDASIVCWSEGMFNRYRCSLNNLVPVYDVNVPCKDGFVRTDVPWAGLAFDVHVCRDGVPCPDGVSVMQWKVDKKNPFGKRLNALDISFVIDDHVLKSSVFRKECDGSLCAHYESDVTNASKYNGTYPYGVRASRLSSDAEAQKAEKMTVVERAKDNLLCPKTAAAVFDRGVRETIVAEHRKQCVEADRVWVCVEEEGPDDVTAVVRGVVMNPGKVSCHIRDACMNNQVALVDVPWECVRPAPKQKKKGPRPVAPDPWTKGVCDRWIPICDIDGDKEPALSKAYISFMYVGEKWIQMLRRMTEGRQICWAVRQASVKTIFSPPRPMTPGECVPGAYAVCCPDCAMVYCGETFRPCGRRFVNHLANPDSISNRKLSAVALHRFEKKHGTPIVRNVIRTDCVYEGEFIEAVLVHSLPPSMRMNAPNSENENKCVRSIDWGWHGALARWLHKWWEKVFPEVFCKDDGTVDDDEIGECFVLNDT